MIRKMMIGEQRIYERMITFDDVKRFGELTGDMNKTHFDEAYAAQTPFKKPIVHGMLIGSLFSRIFGLDYPGEGTIYCSQSVKFLKPVYPNTIINVVVTVKDIILEKNRVIFTTEIFDENKNCVLTGEAMLMPRKEQSNE
ncbi:MAG: MaoC family dehydratase [Tenericutes bacterium]|nr:MaoC family dehydratase [Mycoplasmatota bacterium]